MLVASTVSGVVGWVDIVRLCRYTQQGKTRSALYVLLANVRRRGCVQRKSAAMARANGQAGSGREGVTRSESREEDARSNSEGEGVSDMALEGLLSGRALA